MASRSPSAAAVPSSISGAETSCSVPSAVWSSVADVCVVTGDVEGGFDSQSPQPAAVMQIVTSVISLLIIFEFPVTVREVGGRLRAVVA